MTAEIVLDGESLKLADVVGVARRGVPVSLGTGARRRLVEVRQSVDRIAAGSEPAYGINTGFGKLADVTIPRERLSELQRNLVRSHAAGVGPELPREETRALMLLRANVLARGYSGIRAEVVELLIAMLNAGLHPPIPEQGSVGASGDLAPLAHLALSLIGEGALHGPGGAGPAVDVLGRAGLSPVNLGPKEGLALINGTQAHTAVAALALSDAGTVWLSAHVAGAASLDALLGTPTAFDPRIHEVRGQRGQILSAALFKALCDGSGIRESHRRGDPRVQDAYSLRCMPQVHGPVLDAVLFALGIIERELNAATDNPLVFDGGELISGGNFHGYAVGMAADFLAMSMTALGVMSERRIDRLVNPDLNQGLPPFLTLDAGVSSGFMMAQVTAAALASENRILAHPATVDSIPTDGGKEDVVPMSMGAATKLRKVIANTRAIIAIELLCATQGLDYRLPLRSSPALEKARMIVRGQIAGLTEDRPLSPDIVLADALVAGGAIARLAAECVADVPELTALA
ncbi:MAG: histidine ammonia-lyase [Gemmatimonadota bacterium]